MSRAFDRYRELELKLAEVRKNFGVGVDEEEDRVLDEMDGIWNQMLNLERKAVESSEGASGEHVERFKAYAAWIQANREKCRGTWVVLTYTDQQLVELITSGKDGAKTIPEGVKATWRTGRRPFIHYVMTQEEEKAVD